MTDRLRRDKALVAKTRQATFKEVGKWLVAQGNNGVNPRWVSPSQILDFLEGKLPEDVNHEAR